ncbi:PilZ domain-containing protein [Candidatus Omnitrophota bacterium]
MDTHSEINLSEVCRILWKKKILFLILFSVIFFTVLQVTFLIPPTYRASAKLIIQNEPDLYPGSIIPKTADKIFFNAQKQILLSDLILDKALEDMKNKGVITDNDYSELKEGVFVDYMSNSNVLEARVEGKDEQKIAEFSNAMSSVFIDYHVNAKIDLVNQTLGILTKETKILEKDIEDLGVRLKEFQDKDQLIVYQAQLPYYVGGMLDLQKKNLTTGASIERLEGELYKTNSALKNGNIELVNPLRPSIFGQGAGENPTSSLTASPWLSDLKIKLTDMQAELSNLLVEYTDDYAGTQSVRDKISSLEKNLDKELAKVLEAHATYYEGYIEFLKSQKKSTEVERQQYKAELGKISKDINEAAARQIEFNTLLRNHDTKQIIYATFLQKQKDLELLKKEVSSKAISNIRIFERASLPLKKVSPNLPLNLFLGGFFGIFIGISASLVSERQSGSLKERPKMPMESKGSERRHMSRIDVPLAVEYELIGDAGHTKHNAVSKDISASGVKITTDAYLSKGAKVLLKIVINDKDSIETIGEVIWVGPSEERGIFESGLHFVKIDPREREKLINYLYSEHYLTQALTPGTEGLL